MKNAVIDASIAVKWVVHEAYSDAAARLASARLAAPSLLLAECANALWAKARRDELTTEEARERVLALQSSGVELVPLRELIGDALDLALKLRHPVYDCCYLALAARRSMPLVTADQRFAEAARAWPACAERIVTLDEF